MALVVAMAGMMFPAICFVSNLDFVSMPKMRDLRLALAVTKSRVSSSSLSNVMTGAASPEPLTALCRSCMRLLSLRRLERLSQPSLRVSRGSHLSLNTKTFSRRVHACCPVARIFAMLSSAAGAASRIVA